MHVHNKTLLLISDLIGTPYFRLAVTDLWQAAQCVNVLANFKTNST